MQLISVLNSLQHAFLGQSKYIYKILFNLLIKYLYMFRYEEGEKINILINKIFEMTKTFGGKLVVVNICLESLKNVI